MHQNSQFMLSPKQNNDRQIYLSYLNIQKLMFRISINYSQSICLKTIKNNQGLNKKYIKTNFHNKITIINFQYKNHILKIYLTLLPQNLHIIYICIILLTLFILPFKKIFKSEIYILINQLKRQSKDRQIGEQKLNQDGRRIYSKCVLSVKKYQIYFYLPLLSLLILLKSISCKDLLQLFKLFKNKVQIKNKKNLISINFRQQFFQFSTNYSCKSNKMTGLSSKCDSQLNIE
ncbi:hypothetical protein ABPG74_015066 [Tetrahymena malaccensis]